MKKVTVYMQRGQGMNEAFNGQIKAESSTHYLVTHKTNPTEGEWFAKKSDKVWCILPD